MTLTEAIATLATRFTVDQDADIDTTSNAAMTTALMVAAQLVSRDTYFLFTSKADLTLTASQSEYDLLAAAVCTKRVFHVQEVNINDSWLDEYDWPSFVDANPDYYKQTDTAKPYCFTQIAPGSIRIASPPNATAVSATYKFVTGFYEHPVYTIGDNASTQLLGPTAFHDLIIDRAFLDNSRSYVAGAEGYERRSIIEANYNQKAPNYKEENLAKYRKRRKKGGVGLTRRVNSIGGRRY